MIGRALVGAVAAAIALFILGFIFFASPVSYIGFKGLPDAQAASVQTSLAQNVAETGTYLVPSGRTPDQTTLYGRGPIATIHYNSSGYAIGDAATLLGGFVQMLAVALLMAAGLGALSRFVSSSGERIRMLVLGVLGATAFIHLREPIWFHHDWTHAIYLLVADSVSLIVAGLIILKLLPKEQAAPEDPKAA